MSTASLDAVAIAMAVGAALAAIVGVIAVVDGVRCDRKAKLKRPSLVDTIDSGRRR